MSESYDEWRMCAKQLAEKYNPDGDAGDGQHPEFTRWDWFQVVAQRMTVMGYWEWLEHQIDEQYWRTLK